MSDASEGLGGFSLCSEGVCLGGPGGPEVVFTLVSYIPPWYIPPWCTAGKSFASCPTKFDSVVGSGLMPGTQAGGRCHRQDSLRHGRELLRHGWAAWMGGMDGRHGWAAWMGAVGAAGWVGGWGGPVEGFVEEHQVEHSVVDHQSPPPPPAWSPATTGRRATAAAAAGSSGPTTANSSPTT